MSAKEKRRRRRRRKAQRMGLWTLLFLAEAVAAAAPAALVALALIPTGYSARGGPAMGGEWLAIAATFTAAYAAIHNFVCNKLEEVTDGETGR